MKMLFTTSATNHSEQIQKIFSEHNVTFYNEFEVGSIEKTKKPHRLGNWFGHGSQPLGKIAFFTMIDDDQAENLMQKLEKCKHEMPDCNLHAYLLNIEKGV